MKKLVLLCLLLSMLTACVQFAAAEEQVTLTIWMDDQTEERIQMLESIYAMYEAEHPNVKIDFTALPDDATDKLLVAFDAGTAPDILNITSKNIATYIANGWLANLSPYEEKMENDTILDSAITSARSYDVENGDLYYLPTGCNFYCLWLRTDWMEEKGLDMPTDWDTFFANVEALTDKDNGRYGIALRGGGGAATNLEMLMYAYSGLTEYFTEDGKSTVNDPRHVEFCEKYLGLYNVYSGEGDISYGWTQLAGAFQTGVAACIQHNTGSAASHYAAFEGDTSKFAASAFPNSLDGTLVMQQLSWDGFGIYSGCKNVDAAWDFLYWLCTGEASAIYNEAIGLVPCDDVLLADPDGFVQSPEYPWMQTAAEVIMSEDTLYYKNPSYLPSYASTLSSEVDGLVQSAMAGEITCQEMLDEWAMLMETMLAEEG